MYPDASPFAELPDDVLPNAVEVKADGTVVAPPVKRGRGRPKGSKNKPKVPTVAAGPVVEPVLTVQPGEGSASPLLTPPPTAPLTADATPPAFPPPAPVTPPAAEHVPPPPASAVQPSAETLAPRSTSRLGRRRV